MPFLFPENCTITRMALLLTRFFYKMWFFGAAYYVCTWAFLGVSAGNFPCGRVVQVLLDWPVGPKFVMV